MTAVHELVLACGVMRMSNRGNTPIAQHNIAASTSPSPSLKSKDIQLHTVQAERHHFMRCGSATYIRTTTVMPQVIRSRTCFSHSTPLHLRKAVIRAPSQRHISTSDDDITPQPHGLHWIERKCFVSCCALLQFHSRSHLQNSCTGRYLF